ncbi:MAG: RNA polymerase sigma factor [Salibacteraceae bacterium]
MPESTPKQSQERFLQLYQPVHESLLRFCEAMTRHPELAKELVSEVVLEALENLHKLRDEAAFLGFLFGIARNCHRRKFRRKARETDLPDQVLHRADQNPGPERSAEVALLYEALAKLPEKQQEALLLFEVSGFSLEEIRKIQGGSLSGVKLRLKRGREKLKKLLGLLEPATTG